MDMQKFWSIIDQSAHNRHDVQSSKLRELLSPLSKDELIAFAECYRTALNNAYRWDVWGAAYVINGGCSDDGFDYFRDALISKGSHIYREALADPETLVGKFRVFEANFEEFRYVMHEVLEDKHGAQVEPSDQIPADPAGEPWDEEDLDRLFPALSAWTTQNMPTYPDPTPSVAQPHTRARTQPRRFWQKLLGRK